MKFKFEHTSLILKDYFIDGEPEKNLLLLLNEHFKGWVFVGNETRGDQNCVAHVDRYIQDYRLMMEFNMFSADEINKEVVENEDIKVNNSVSKCTLFETDTIYKLEEIEEPQKGRIRWYKKGKLEEKLITKFKMFENDNHEDVDPYGEENWNGPQIYDYSGDDKDSQVEMLKKLIVDGPAIRFSEPNVDFYYTKKVIEEGNEDGSDEEKGPGDALDEILDIFLDEDGDLIFVGSHEEYIEEEDDDYEDHSIYYTVDTTKSIYLGKDIEIKL